MEKGRLAAEEGVDVREPGEPREGASGCDRLTRRANPLDGEIEGIERLSGIARRIFDREAGDAGLDCELHVHGDAVRIAREAMFEVRVHRYVHDVCNLAKVLQRLLASHAV